MPAHEHCKSTLGRWLAALVAIGLLASGCIRTTPRVIKIGLVAPFEGRYREVGVDVIPAARLAIREWAVQHRDDGLAVELVAFDDAGDPDQAVEQARRIAADPAVAVVIGHWRDETTSAAAPVYQEAELPLVTFSEQEIESSAGVYNLAPSATDMRAAIEGWLSQQDPGAYLLLNSGDDVLVSVNGLTAASPSSHTPTIIGGPVWGLSQFYTLAEGGADGTYFASGFAEPGDTSSTLWTSEHVENFRRGYEESSLGSPPGLLAAAAYEATWVAIERALVLNGIEPPETPASSLAFGAEGRRVDAPIYLYRWQNGQRELVAVWP